MRSNVKEATYIRLNILLKQLDNQSLQNKSSEINQNSTQKQETEEELIFLVTTLGKEATNFVNRSLLTDIDWLKLDPQTIKSYYQSSQNLPNGMKYLSKSIQNASLEDNFEDYIADLINCMPIFKKLTPDFLLSLAKNFFLFISVIGNLEEEKQLLLCLGFIYSGIEFYSIVGQENLVYLVKHLIKNIRLAYINTEILNKILIIFIGNYEKKAKEEKELNFSNQEQVNSSKSNINTFKIMIKNINKELSSEERSSQSFFESAIIKQKEKEDQQEIQQLYTSLYKEIEFEKIAYNLGPSYLSLIYSKENKDKENKRKLKNGGDLSNESFPNLLIRQIYFLLD